MVKFVEQREWQNANGPMNVDRPSPVLATKGDADPEWLKDLQRDGVCPTFLALALLFPIVSTFLFRHLFWPPPPCSLYSAVPNSSLAHFLNPLPLARPRDHNLEPLCWSLRTPESKLNRSKAERVLYSS